MGAVRAALIEFELESTTQNVRSFYAGYASTSHYFTREAVCSALSYTETLWHNRRDEYQPLSFPFDSTPAEPIRIHTADVLYRSGDNANEGLLRFGKQEVILPGSQFRCSVWGDLPALEIGQVFLIGKKRAPARIVSLIQQSVTPDHLSEGILLPVQLPPRRVMSFGAFIPLVGAQRYFILKIPLQANIKRFSIAGYAVPLVQGEMSDGES